MKKGHGMHWHCCLMPMLGGLCWIVGLLSVIYACVAIRRGDMFWGLTSEQWLWHGLVLGILAMGVKGKRPGMCQMSAKCGCGQASCSACSGGSSGKCC